LSDVTSNILDVHVPTNGKKEEWNFEGLNTALTQQFGLRIDFQSMPAVDTETVTQSVSQAVKNVYDHQKQNLGQYFEQIQKMILLQAIDQRWKEHLALVDRLKEGVGLRGYSGKDPVIEYKKEAFNAFNMLNTVIKADSIEKLLKVQIVDQQQADAMKDMLQAPDMDELEFHGADEASAGGGIALPQRPPPASNSEPPAQKQKMRMTGGPASDGPQRPMNREERRRLEKGKRS